MTTVFLSPIGNDAPFMRNGVPASGCKLFAYVSGSTTKQNTYTDNTGNSANANPIILNSEGYPASGGNVISIWLTQGATYKFVLAPSTDTDPPSSPIWSRDNISGVDDVTLSQSEWVGGPTPTFVSSTQFTLVGDQTSNFHVGRRVKYTVTAGTGYATITASAFGAVTTVTVDSQGSNALDSGLSAVSYSLIRADNFTQSIGLDAITRYATAIAAAAALNLNAVGGDHVHISSATSTTTITSATLSQGHERTVTFDSPQILSSNASFIIPTGTLTASTGDNIRLRGEPSNVVRTVSVFRFGGQPLSGFGYEPLGTITASGAASMDFTSVITLKFDAYMIDMEGIIPSTNAESLLWKVSVNNGGSFIAGTGYNGSRMNNTAVSSTPAGGADSGAANLTIFDSLSNTAGNGLWGQIWMHIPSGNIASIQWNASAVNSAANVQFMTGGGIINAGAQVNAVQLKFTGNINGTARIYGLKKS